MIRRAVIPAAGRGTRMRPLSYLVPKELVPLGNVPAIHLVIGEACRAGITEIALVLGPDKDLIRRYVERICQVEDDWASLRFAYPTQERPEGLAEAIALCRDFVAGEPFALLLPDNVLFSPRHRLAHMAALYEKEGLDVVGILELDSRHSLLFGNCGRFDYETVRPGVFRLTRLYDKEPGSMEIGPAETIYRTCGRYICHPDVFDYIDRLRPKVQGEFDDVPVYQEIVAERGALGLLLPPPLFDVGNPRGYLAASAYLYEQES